MKRGERRGGKRVMGFERMKKGYEKSDAPWKFRGKALYQLHLVKEEDAKRFVPEALHAKMVRAFGYTLGGVYLARYDSSPVGAFDELVVLAGLLWDGPTSAAWAARVFVNDKAAMKHGIDAVGLPSRFARFRFRDARRRDHGATVHNRHNHLSVTSGRSMTIDIASTAREIAADADSSIATTHEANGGQRRRRRQQHKLLSASSQEQRSEKGNETHSKAPKISLALPSFSGSTVARPELLRYALRLRAGVGLAEKLHVHVRGSPTSKSQNEAGQLGHLLSGPHLLTMRFDAMDMSVEKPVKLELGSSRS